jgi:hypothetical protein
MMINYDTLYDYEIYTKADPFRTNQCVNFYNDLKRCHNYNFLNFESKRPFVYTTIRDETKIDSKKFESLVYDKKSIKLGWPIQCVRYWEKNCRSETIEGNPEANAVWYKQLFSDYELPDYWEDCTEGIFSVSCESIHQHNQSIYEYLVDKYLPERKLFQCDLFKEENMWVRHDGDWKGILWHDEYTMFWKPFFCTLTKEYGFGDKR